MIAIEPQSQCWLAWPDRVRLLALPVAIYLERGTMDFHVNADDATSSLAPSAKGTRLDSKIKTVETRTVPVLRLEDVLAAIPPEVAIPYLKTDVQGVDLEVLQSAGEQLRRVGRVRAEIMNAPYYGKVAGRAAGTEAEMLAFMTSMGFKLLGEHDVQRDREWLDKDFVNTRLPR